MQILRVYPFLPPLPGGMEKHILRLTEEQRHLGCEVTLAFNRGEASSANDIQILPSFNLRRVKPQALRDFIFYLLLIIKLALYGHRFDIVHIHGDWSAFLLGKLLRRVVNAEKLVGSVHGVSLRGLRQSLYRLALSGYSMVYATGAQDAAHLSLICKRLMRWQHSGIDSIFIDSTSEHIRSYDVISVGSFVPIKNYSLIVEIAALSPNLSFLLVGDGPQKTTLEMDCRQRGIVNIYFAGHLPSISVVEKLRTAKVFLLTSLGEGTPTAILEAMACGLAVVTSRSNNYTELITEGLNGYVVDGFNAASYVNKIQDVLASTEKLREISSRNQLQAVSYTWPKVAKRITDWMQAC